MLKDSETTSVDTSGSVVTSVITKVTSWSKTKKYIVGGVIAIVCLVLLFYGLKGPGMGFVQGMLDDYIKDAKTQWQQEMNEKDKVIQEKEKLVADLNKQLEVARSDYEKTKQELERLKEVIENVAEPKDIKEIKERFKKLGYNIR
jgi:septal ring factor EnvC (AmiA/AmiB activator)